MLPFSNWEWATTCSSESLASLRRGTQSAVQQLGHVPDWHQTDNSTAATHQVGPDRVFNEDYLTLMAHLGMRPRTTAIGAMEQNGDVESLHRSLKRRLDQKLRLRGSRDFASPEHYESWMQQILTGANRDRTIRLQEELDVMKPLTASPLPEYQDRRDRARRKARRQKHLPAPWTLLFDHAKLRSCRTSQITTKEDALPHVDPTTEQSRALQQLDHHGPILMLNLLRFVPETGRGRYTEYKSAVMPLLAEAGASIAASGAALATVIGPSDETWDEMLVVRYPSRSAFSGLVTSDAYGAIRHLRAEALVDSRLVCLAPAD